MACCSSVAFTNFVLFGKSSHVLRWLPLTSTFRKFPVIEHTIHISGLQKRFISQSVKYRQICKENIRKQQNNYKMSEYTVIEKGAPNSTNYSIYLKNQAGAIVSPLHDIPLYADDKKTILNMVVEIPRWTNAKMEISTNTPLNPIKQDVKKGKLRFVANCFPHKGYIWNYGAFPQTWENPGHIEPSTGCKGDNDPIDVLEIGYRVAKRGEVIQVKILGTVALIDEGETDWKIITIDVNDPLAEKMNDIGDVDKYFPGLLRATVEWFKIYKIPDGKPENKFAFNGDAKCAAFANNIIEETNKFWKGLISKELDGGDISLANTSNADTPGFVKSEESEQILASAPDGGEPEELSNTEMTMASPELRESIGRWLKWDQCEKTRSEVNALVKACDWEKLSELLLTRLAFGTAGLRGKMRAGFNGMNDLVVAQTAQGLSTYITKQFSDNDCKTRGVVFGYDGRHNSKRFAELSANIFIRAGFKVYLYRRLVATPLVPYTIRHFNCIGGVMVTASHNPKDDNGYKVYWSNGAQIISPHDKSIQKAILTNLEPNEGIWNTADLYENENLADPKEAIVSYVDKLRDTLPSSIIEGNSQSNLRFVYSAMHGVGYPFIQDTFAAIKLQPVIAVEEQKDADPEFSTVQFPNPEEGRSALELSIKKADSTGCSIILANDPDADRLALATKNANTGKWKVYNGNEIAALLGWWALHLHKYANAEGDLCNCYMLASTVSSKILKAFAQKHGFHFIETLTGFKWMGNEADKLIKDGKTVLFAFEEAIGFMFSTNVLDKDGISAACHLASLACYLQAKEQISFDEKLQNIYKEYGFHYNNSSYYFCYEPSVIKKIFERLRNFKGEPKTYPTSILEGKYKIKHIRDLTNGVDTSQHDGKAILPVSASNQMITFTFENGLVITLRTSGTEPKIKYYAEMCAQPGQTDFEGLIDTTNEMVSTIVEEFLQPKEYKLTPKSD